MNPMCKKEIKACPRCGNLNIKAPSFEEGGIPGVSELSGTCYCKRCGKNVTPIIFDDGAAYKKFIKNILH